MRVRLKHVTRYHYDKPAAFGPHVVRLHPARHTRTQVSSYALGVEPEGAVIHWQQDPWGNRVARASFPADLEATELVFTVDMAVEIRPVNPFDFFVDDRCRELPFVYPDGLQDELAPFIAGAQARLGPQLKRWLGDAPPKGNTVDWLVALNQKAADTIRYVIRQEAGIQTSEETLEKASGSCRDIAVMLVDALRASGLAARFASGYLVQLTDEGNIPDLAKGVANDVVDLHAWAEVFVPGAGWIGLDGTSGLFCGEGHIPLCSAVHPDLAAPISGTTSEPVADFAFSMHVARIGHEPSPRRPYTDEEWAALLAAGSRVDERLRGHGLRLTMGGEPTWTSREHPREPEWLTEANGPTKRAQGLRFARELRARLGEGALALERPGKWYPGESLPRWALDLIWRKDGVPIWRDPALLAFGDGLPPRASSDRARVLAGLDAARALSLEIARRLEVLGAVEAALQPGFEDPWRALMEEENLPTDVDPLRADLDEPEDRRRLARLLAHGLGNPVGFVLPLARPSAGAPWTTQAWSFRRGKLFLIPGDSPMGLRLPLGRIGGKPDEPIPPDLTRGAAPLGFDPRQGRRQRAIEASEGAAAAAALAAQAASLHTALCVEPREGVPCVFVPPLERAEDFLELVAAIEDAASALDLAVRVEGYPPPRDPRLDHCVVSPDPAVLEFNMPVTERFEDYARIMEIAADAANHSGLSTERYQLDGREVGSGGGHHLTLGGPSTLQSPFLVRPDLLASLLRYTQNHPSLSYLFTGQFVGPTSQAPRVDEARHDALYELELALSRVPSPGASGEAPPAPWLIDRLLRNLLADVSGNTHRTELSIDKLYDPAGPAGRQGIVELRAFEMPPHERMAVAQMLLVRSLAARFAAEPYDRPLVRWNTELHDRFMLPSALWQDLTDVLRDLDAHGLPTDPAWFRPFVDYRFPVLGTVDLDGVLLELRPALEPWPVLGEEPTGATVSRYVDSSLERLQVRVDGLVEGRHQVLVNGYALPLKHTGTVGERIAGVRFRAWQPPHCLQPTIGIHHPLRFDVVDTWGKRSLGAATYHVWHPEGRGYAEPPLTAFEAAARRAQRFTTTGHAPWPVQPAPTAPHPESPWTLDLRRLPIDRPPPRPDAE